MLRTQKHVELFNVSKYCLTCGNYVSGDSVIIVEKVKFIKGKRRTIIQFFCSERCFKRNILFSDTKKELVDILDKIEKEIDKLQSLGYKLRDFKEIKSSHKDMWSGER